MKYFSIIILFLLSLVLFSCDDNISFKSEIEKNYSVNMILRGDTSLQTAYVSHVYDVNGFDPFLLSTDPFVDNATVTINYTDTEALYLMRDTTDNSKLNPRYNSSSKYYFIDNFTPHSGKGIELKVHFDDGQVIYGNAEIPEQLSIDAINTIRYIPGPFIKRDEPSYNFAWDGGDPNLLKMIKISFGYKHRDIDGNFSFFTKQVPMAFIIENSDTTEDYNGITYTNYFELDKKFLDKALRDISKDDPSKGRYTLINLKAEIFALDENLTNWAGISR
jgi:hypothetical protein